MLDKLEPKMTGVDSPCTKSVYGQCEGWSDRYGYIYKTYPSNDGDGVILFCESKEIDPRTTSLVERYHTATMECTGEIVYNRPIPSGVKSLSVNIEKLTTPAYRLNYNTSVYLTDKNGNVVLTGNNDTLDLTSLGSSTDKLYLHVTCECIASFTIENGTRAIKAKIKNITFVY